MSGEVEICNAGHCAPLLLHDGSVLPIAATGLPRGMFCQERYSSTQIKLGKGDRLLLYTDGLSETRDSGDNEDGADGSVKSIRLEEAISAREKLKRIVLKTATAIVSTVLTVSILVVVDLYLHHKHQVNVWGYRGPAVGQKQFGEKRIAVLGGSTTWGYGLGAAQSFPGQLQQRLAERLGSQGAPTINVLNLGFNNEGAYSFKYTLKDYDYLDYDEVVLYSGYNDLGGENQIVLRHRSPIFIWTGYFPLLPALTADKISFWKNRLTNGDRPVVFSPPAKESETGEQTSRSLQKQLGSLTDSGRSEAGSQGTCPVEWQFYCQQIYEVTDAALRRGKRVLIVTEPYISDKHVEQQRALEGMLTKRFAGQADFRYLNLGRTVDLRDESLCWDGMHLTEEGNRRIAQALAQPVVEMFQR